MMAVTVKHLIRPYITMAQSYAAASLCRPTHLPRAVYLHTYATRVRTLTTSPAPLTTTRTNQWKCRKLSSSTTTGASAPHHVNDPGSIDSSLMQSMETKIRDELNAESVSVKDAYGDGRHVSIVVVSSAFEGKSAVSRQRMVYKAIWEELQTTVHAVDQMITKTPSE